MRRITSLFVIVALSLASRVGAAYSCILSDPITLDNDGLVQLQQFINEDEGTYTMKVTYSGGQSYVAIGINEEGRAKMIPSTAVMGRADGDSPTVDRYILGAYTGIELATSNDGLFNTSFTQTESTSTLTFTQSLNQASQIGVSDETQWIFAVGPEGNMFTRHAIQGSFQLPLSRTCTLSTTTSETQVTESTTSETEAETETESVAEENVSTSDNTDVTIEDSEPADTMTTLCPLTDPITLDEGGQLELQQFVNSQEGTFTMKLTYYGGQAFIGIGVNDEGLPKMTPSTAVIGRADGETPSVQKYRMTASTGVQLADTTQQTLINTSFVQTDETSTLIFTQLLNEPGQVSIRDETQWIYAVGFSDNRWMGHSIQGSFKLSLSPTCDTMGTTNGASTAQSGIVISNIIQPDRQMWMAHGIMMALAWGICAPLAIGSSILRTIFDRLAISNDKSLWFKIHLYMNLGTALLTLIGFSIAIAAKNQQQVKHFESTHAKMGLSIFIMVLLQVLAGMFRPSLPKNTQETPNEGDEESNGEKKQGQKDVLDKTEREQSTDMHESVAFTSKMKPNKSSVRLAWEVGHRIMGLCLLAMTWYNCHTGIVWSSMVWEENKDWTGAFWGVVGGLCAIIFAFRIALKVTE